MGGVTQLSRHHFDSAEILLLLVLALVVAWVVGVGIGERVARHVQGEHRPSRTVGGLMRFVLVVALLLVLLSGDLGMFLYALVLTPLIATVHYLFRPR